MACHWGSPPRYAARPPLAGLRIIAVVVNSAGLLSAHQLAGLLPAAVTCVVQAALARKAFAACASGPEVGSVRPYMVSCCTVLPVKLSTRLFQKVADT